MTEDKQKIEIALIQSVLTILFNTIDHQSHCWNRILHYSARDKVPYILGILRDDGHIIFEYIDTLTERQKKDFNKEFRKLFEEGRTRRMVSL